jgi:hypothetical protein
MLKTASRGGLSCGACLLAVIFVVAAAPQPESKRMTVVVFETEKGAIEVEIDTAIQASPTGRQGEYGTESLDPPIKVMKAYRR